MSSLAEEHQKLILDGTKIAWHAERIKAWKGRKIAPITIDMALTRACNYSCGFCYAMFRKIQKDNNKKVIFDFLEDCAEIGVGISFVSDGEEAIFPAFIDACKRSWIRIVYGSGL